MSPGAGASRRTVRGKRSETGRPCMSPASPSEPTRRLRLPVPVGAKTSVRGRHAVRRMGRSWAIGACVRPDVPSGLHEAGARARSSAIMPPVLALNMRSRNRGARRQARSIYARHHAPKRRRRFRRQRRAPTRRSSPRSITFSRETLAGGRGEKKESLPYKSRLNLTSARVIYNPPPALFPS